MNFIAATLQVALHTFGVRARERLTEARRRSPGSTDRGSVTIEQVIWAVAVIAIVGIVVVALTNYVTTKAGQIK